MAGLDIYFKEDIANVANSLEEVGLSLEGPKRDGYLLALDAVRLAFGIAPSALALPARGEWVRGGTEVSYDV